MQEGGDGRLWIASLRNGLFLYDALNDAMVRHYTPENAQNSFIPTFCVMGLFRDAKGMVWIGGEDGFLGSVDERSGLTHSYRTYFPKEDVNINTVYDIINVDGHTIWVGTDAGLMKYGVEGDQLRLQNAYTSENGIASDIVKSIARAGDGSIWCITSTSLCRFDPSTGTVINYGFNDGLQNPGIGERIQSRRTYSGDQQQQDRAGHGQRILYVRPRAYCTNATTCSYSDYLFCRKWPATQLYQRTGGKRHCKS